MRIARVACLLASVVAADSFVSSLGGHPRGRLTSITPPLREMAAPAQPAQPTQLTQRSQLLASAADGPSGEEQSSWLIRNRSILLLIALVIHKCATDGITRWTRLQTSYSGATVAVMSEVAKFPLIAAAIASLGGGVQEILPVLKAAFVKKPAANAWIALCYTFNNLLYFDALSALSAVAYQVIACLRRAGRC